MIYKLNENKPKFPEDGDFWVAPDANVIGKGLDPTRRVRLAQRSHGHRGRVGAGVQLRGARRAGVSRARPAFAGEA